MYRKSFVEVNVDNINFNIKNILKKYNDYKYYIAVVKGNVYGHGEYILNDMLKSGINYFAVSSLEEALSVRKTIPKTPILILQPIHIKELNIAIENNLTITLSSYDYFKQLKKQNIKDLKIHLKLNTGMNRLGINDSKEVEDIYHYFKDKNNLEGLYSHLATTGILDKRYDEQINNFYDLTKNIDLSKIKIIHLFRSTSLELHPKVECCNGVRLGIMMYGYGQTFIKNDNLKNSLRRVKYGFIQKKDKISPTYQKTDLELREAFELKSEIIEIKKIKKGDMVGYAGTYNSETDEYIAVCPIGYADGLRPGYQNKKVMIRDKFYTIVGVISMGMITIKIDEDIKVGDIVTIVGDKVNVKTTADFIHTSPYIIVTSINKNVPRIYKKGLQKVKEIEY